MKTNTNPEIHAKIVFVGAAYAGKTSILNRYIRGQFTNNLPTSTQPACFRKSYESKGITVNLELWDTAGQERYHSLAPLFYRDSQIGVVVFDMTDTESFNAAKEWCQELVQARGNEIQLFIVANKLDLALERTVQFKEIVTWAESVKAKVYETSAKTGENIEPLFLSFVEAAEQKVKATSPTADTTATVSQNETPCAC